MIPIVFDMAVAHDFSKDKHSLKICGLCSCQERVKEAETLVSRCKRERVLELRRLMKRHWRFERNHHTFDSFNGFFVTAFERFKASTTVLQYQILNSPWRRLFERKQKHPLIFTHSEECERSEEGASLEAISLAASFIFLHGSRVKLLQCLGSFDVESCSHQNVRRKRKKSKSLEVPSKSQLSKKRTQVGYAREILPLYWGINF